MSPNVIQIFRGRRLIADGYAARVLDVPQGSVERSPDIHALAQAAGISATDTTTGWREFRIPIARQHGSVARAITHAMLAPQVAVSEDDLKISFHDGTDLHEYIAEGAGWKMATVDKCEGAGTRITYSITAPILEYYLNDVLTAPGTDDA